jgi:two-component system KDP operon response regulator KdpE
MAAAGLLVIDDDPRLASALESAMDRTRYALRVATTAEEGILASRVDPPDVTILNVDLAGAGVDLCRRLHDELGAPVIAVSDDADPESKVAVLDAGADDYLVRPVSVTELLARVRVALRHRAALAPLRVDALIEVGDLRIDPVAHVAAIGARRLELTPKEFRLLVLLARNAGRTVRHGTILQVVWSSTTPPDTLRLHVSQLRRKLGAGPGAPALVTRAGVGYQLAAADQG